MATIRLKRSELSDESKNVDWDRLRATTEDEIEVQAVEDGTADLDLTAIHAEAPSVDLRALRARLELSVEAFARRYLLSARTVACYEHSCSFAGRTDAPQPKRQVKMLAARTFLRNSTYMSKIIDVTTGPIPQ